MRLHNHALSLESSFPLPVADVGELAAERPSSPAAASWIKRATDVVVAATALIFFAPAFVLIGVLLYLQDGAPIIYTQRRIGSNGRPFECWKFRTMARNSQELLEEILRTCETSRQEWIEAQKLKKDPRVHAVGFWLRKSSLDELPQLINVLRGEMSVVGPRPVVESELERYGENVCYYLAQRPGITGLWQVSGRSDTSYSERVALDVDYFKKWTLGGDLAIMLRTVLVVLTGRGSR